jgi:hypothetical protein
MHESLLTKVLNPRERTAQRLTRALWLERFVVQTGHCSVKKSKVEGLKSKADSKTLTLTNFDTTSIIKFMHAIALPFHPNHLDAPRAPLIQDLLDMATQGQQDCVNKIIDMLEDFHAHGFSKNQQNAYPLVGRFTNSNPEKSVLAQLEPT